MGQPKSKRSAMLDPRHRAVLLKEKYRQQMERQDTDAENAETQAVGRVESAAEWAAEELRERVPQAPKKKLPVKERPSTYDEVGHETGLPSERRERRLRSVLPRKTPVRSRRLTTACQQRSSSLRPVVNSWWTSRKRSGGQSDRLHPPPQTHLRSMTQTGSLYLRRAQKRRAKVPSRNAGRALCRDIAARTKRKSRPMHPRTDAPCPR